MILMFAADDDVHAHCVAQELRALGKCSAIVDTARLGRDLRLSHEVGESSVLAGLPETGSLRSDEIKTVWLRRPGRIDLSGLVPDAHLEFATREWRDCLWGWLDDLEARMVSPLVAQERATKPRQLDAARAAGLRVPRTCVTNDADAWRDFVARVGGDVIHKTLTQTELMMMQTMPCKPGDEIFFDNLAVSPVILQERIRGPRDVRLTIIGHEVFGAVMRTPPDIADCRLVLDSSYEVWPVPSQTESQLHDMMARLGLVFGTIDLKIAADGEPCFLEVNPQGQFAYVEIETGMPLMHAFARFLAAD